MKTNSNKILIATPLYPPQVGGPASRTVLLESKFPDMGIQVRVAKFSTFLWLPKVLRHIAYFFTVLFKGLGVDTVLAQDPASTGLPVLLATRLLRKRMVLIIVGDYAWEQSSQRFGVSDLLDKFSTENDKYPLMVRVFKKVQLFVASHADTVIVPSNYLKGVVTNWGVSADKITVVYNSFNPPQIPGDKNELRNKLGLSGHVLVSAGRLVPWKGFVSLIESVVPELLKQFPDIKLFIIGDGPDRDHLEDLVKKNKLEKHVFLLGRKPQKELFEYVVAADVFVLNTAYEGMSHQLLEVMALGTPIVTTNIGGNQEIITDKYNGLLVDYNNSDSILVSVSSILSDGRLGEKLVENGREKIMEFSEEKMLNKLKDILV